MHDVNYAVCSHTAIRVAMKQCAQSRVCGCGGGWLPGWLPGWPDCNALSRLHGGAYLVDIWCVRRWVPVEPQVAIAQIVNKQHDDVGFVQGISASTKPRRFKGGVSLCVMLGLPRASLQHADGQLAFNHKHPPHATLCIE